MDGCEIGLVPTECLCSRSVYIVCCWNATLAPHHTVLSKSIPRMLMTMCHSIWVHDGSSRSCISAMY